jgi:hypothetical protein
MFTAVSEIGGGGELAAGPGLLEDLPEGASTRLHDLLAEVLEELGGVVFLTGMVGQALAGTRPLPSGERRIPTSVWRRRRRPLPGGQSLREGADRYRQPARLLTGEAAFALRLEHGLARRAIQRRFPRARVVKALNTMNCEVMVDPGKVPGEHDVFLCGDDVDAKRQVGELLESFGWPAGRIRDLGAISSARGTEMYVGLWGAVGTGYFNIAVVQAPA